MQPVSHIRRLFLCQLSQRATKYLCVLLFICGILLISGCSPKKPSAETINKLLAERSANRSWSNHGWSNVTILNQWHDENSKGVYYVKIGYDLNDRWVASKWVATYRFEKQGDKWGINNQPIEEERTWYGRP